MINRTRQLRYVLLRDWVSMFTRDFFQLPVTWFSWTWCCFFRCISF